MPCFFFFAHFLIWKCLIPSCPLRTFAHIFLFDLFWIFGARNVSNFNILILENVRFATSCWWISPKNFPKFASKIFTSFLTVHRSFDKNAANSSRSEVPSTLVWLWRVWIQVWAFPGLDHFPSMFSCLFRAWRFLPRLSHLKRLLGCKTQYQYLENDSQMKPKLLSGNGANGHFGHGSNMSLWALSNTLQGRGQQRGRRAVSSFGNFCEVICGSLAALQLRREGQGLAECQVGGGHQQSMPKILPFWDVKSHFKSCWTPTCGIKWPLGGRSKE